MRRQSSTRRRFAVLSHDEVVELWLGPRGEGISVFESDGTRRDAWLLHRQQLSENAGVDIGRWWAAKHYGLPGGAHEASTSLDQAQG